MPVMRVNKNKNYTTMSNVHLRDLNLSLKARGLLSTILSLPNNWNYSIGGIAAICKENEACIKSGLKELKEAGYMVVEKLYSDESGTGKFKYVYNIFENPDDSKELRERIEKRKLSALPEAKIHLWKVHLWKFQGWKSYLYIKILI